VDSADFLVGMLASASADCATQGQEEIPGAYRLFANLISPE
jgi:hypothetical protein